MAPQRSLPHLSSQPHRGVGARLVRRLGDAVRYACGGGSALTARLRRPTAPQPCLGHPMVRAAARARPAPGQSPRVRLPRATPPAASSLPARHLWLARWFTCRRRPASCREALLPPGAPDAPFTPAAFPQLTPTFCKILNTPLEDCDPATLNLLFGALAETLAATMAGEPGAMDTDAVFATLWSRLAAAVDQPADAAPAAPPEPLPAAPSLSPDPSPAAPPPRPVPSLARAAALPYRAPIAPCETAPGAASPPTRGLDARQTIPHFRTIADRTSRRCGRLPHAGRPLFRHPLPRPLHATYAARASPA